MEQKGEFAVVFGAMGVKHDVADFFQKTFEESGVGSCVYVLESGNDPVVERLITPKVALTVAEYLAFEKICIFWLFYRYDFLCRGDA